MQCYVTVSVHALHQSADALLCHSVNVSQCRCILCQSVDACVNHNVDVHITSQCTLARKNVSKVHFWFWHVLGTGTDNFPSI